MVCIMRCILHGIYVVEQDRGLEKLCNNNGKKVSKQSC